MYGHTLSQLIAPLTDACGVAALQFFCGLLDRAASLGGKVRTEPPADYSYITSGPVADEELAKHGIYEALINAVRRSGIILVQRSASCTRDVVSLLLAHRVRIFKRIALSVLSINPGAAPELAKICLTDTELMGADWCQKEYAELARAWFPSLAPNDQHKVLHLADCIPNQLLEGWKQRFEQHEKRPPTSEDERIFRAVVVRDAMWDWRDVLPQERQEALAATAAEHGEPDAWKERFWGGQEESPLSSTEFIARPVDQIVTFLKDWRPTEKRKRTVTALAQELRSAVEQDPAKFASGADQFCNLTPIYVRRLLEGLGNATRNKRNFDWSSTLKLIEQAVLRMNEPVEPSTVAEGDDSSRLCASSAASDLLKAGLQRGAEGPGLEHADLIGSIVHELYQRAPRQPELEDFEERYTRNPYFASEATLRGSAVELSILTLFWLSKHSTSAVARDVGNAIAIQPHVRSRLEAELGDQSTSGRIPRAIVGRYLSWLHYFGKDWLRSHLEAMLPEMDNALRQATWAAHLDHDNGPISALMPQLHSNYADEIARLTDSDVDPHTDARRKRLGQYLMILYLRGELPNDLFEQFVTTSPARSRQEAMWFLGTQLRRENLPSECRDRGLSYWEARLGAAESFSRPDEFREELGAIGHWCGHAEMDTRWLLDQLVRMLKAGFAPDFAYSVVDWLATSHLSISIEQSRS